MGVKLIWAFLCILVALSCGCNLLRPSGAETWNFHMGDHVQMGPLVINVFETKWLPQLGEGDKARVPKDRFLLLKMNVVNGGVSESTVPLLSIVGDDKQVYSELTNGDQVPEWLGILRHIKSNESQQGHVVFDAPPGHYKLKIEDENLQKIAFVDIPLRFTDGAELAPAKP